MRNIESNKVMGIATIAFVFGMAALSQIVYEDLWVTNLNATYINNTHINTSKASLDTVYFLNGSIPIYGTTTQTTLYETATSSHAAMWIQCDEVHTLWIQNREESATDGAGVQIIAGDNYPYGTNEGDRLGFVLFKGWDISGSLSAGAGFLSYATEEYPRTGGEGADFRIQNTQTGATARQNVATFVDDNFTLPQLSGSGGAYLCIGSAGQVYRSTTPCI